MRKLSKILSVALVLCLLCGAIVMSVFADTTEDNASMLKMTNHERTKADDFESSAGKFYSYNGMSFASTAYEKDSYGNQYLRLFRKDGATAASGSNYFYYDFDYTHWQAAADDVNFISFVSSGEALVGRDDGLMGNQVSAIVLDFDFGSDMYSYDLNGTRQMSKTVPDDATNARLALDGLDASDSALCMLFRTPNDDGTAGDSSYAWARLKCVDNEWYLAANQDGTGKQIKLSNKAGVLDHITVVMLPRTAKTALASYYVNGEKLNDCVVGKSNGQYTYLDELRITFNGSTQTSTYSIAMDNVAINYYPKPYESTEGFGIDDFAKGEDSTKKIYDCVDVVYNADYVQSGVGYVSVGDGAKYTLPAFFETALAGVKTGDVINVDGANVSGFTPAEDVESFTVNITNGGSFALSAEAASKYVGKESAGSLVYSLATDDDKVTIQWIDSDGETVLAESELALGAIPNDSSVPAVSESLNYATGKILGFSKWVWDPDGAGEEYSDMDLCALNDDILLGSWLNDETPGVIQIKPVMAERDAAFGLINANGAAYAPEGYKISDFASISYTTLAGMISAAESGSTLKFYDDNADGKLLMLDLVNMATISKENFKLNVDLNGLTVLQYNGSGGYGSAWFIINANGVELNIYNGSIIQTFPNGGTDSAYTIYGASGVVNTAVGVDNCTVNFGTADGTQPFNYYGGTVFYGNGDKTTTTSGNGRIYCNVYGGMYMMTTRVAYSLFAVLCPDVTITIHDAKIYANTDNSAYGVFADYDGQVTPGQEIYCYDTAILRFKTGGVALPLFGDKINGLKAYFEGCTIFAQHKNATQGEVIFGPGNILINPLAANVGEANSSNAYRLASNVAKAPANNSVKTIVPLTYLGNFSMSVTKGYTVAQLKDPTSPVYNFRTDNFDLGIAYITYDTTKTDNLPDGVAEVDFSLDGTSTYAKEYWVVGSSIGSEGPAYSMESIALNNGWFDIAYDGWVSASGSNVIAESGNSFIPAKIAVPNIKNVKLNMSLYGHFGINLYVPPAIEGVTWNGFYETDGTQITTNNSSRFIDGVKYEYNTWYPSVDTFTTMTRVVKFTITEYDLNGNGTIEDSEKNIALEQSFSYGVLDYVERVLNHPSYGCGTEAATLMHDLIQYMEEGTLLCSPSTITEDLRKSIDAIYAKFTAHGAECECGTDLDSIVFSAEELAITKDSYSGLSSVAYGITYVMDNQPNLSVYLKPLAAGQTAMVSVMAKGIDGEDISYGRVNAGVADTYQGNACTRYDSVSMPGYAIKSVLTITITITTEGVDEPAVYTGQFCLAEYIDNNPTVTAAKAFWAYSNSAYEYRVVRVGEEE